MTPTVRRNDSESRYEITVDGGLAGLVAYADHEGRRIMDHTEVFDAFAGRGLSSTLVAGALADICHTGSRVVPVCPVAAAYLRRHPDHRRSDRPSPACERPLKRQQCRAAAPAITANPAQVSRVVVGRGRPAVAGGRVR
ncbi:GNAT family N-acetyltransferase [Nocardia sp. NPDC005745]|uniref:GNAT family N-acetyltransferase n=1 Tax=Nocardia sp. NPDC005745 TaxID=3157061 RepID=UPI0033FBFFE5